MLCSQKNMRGEPCKAHAVEGSDRCAAHLRLSPQSKLTEEIIARLATLVRAGNYIATACAAAGVPRQSFYAWLRRGESTAPGDGLYRKLKTEIDQARAEGEAALVTRITLEAQRNWAAAAWMLERSYPDRWARPSQREKSTSESGAEPDVEQTSDPFAEVDELARARIKRRPT